MKIINDFMDRIYRGAPIPDAIISNNSFTAPPGYVFAMVNICGRATPLILPNTFTGNALIIGPGLATSLTGTCKCNSGSGCTYHKSKAGTISCIADGCTNCSLTMSSISPSLPPYSYIHYTY